MSPKKYNLTKLDDLQILQLLREFGESFNDNDATAKISVGFITGLEVDLNDNLEYYSGRYSIETAQISCALSSAIKSQLTVYRNLLDNQKVQVLQAHWSVSGNSNTTTQLEPFHEEIANIASLLNKHVLIADPTTDLSAGDFSTALDALTSQHQQMMSTLHGKINDFDKKREDWDREKTEERRRNAEDLNREKDEIAEERRKLQLDSPRAERRKILDDFTKEAGHLADDVSIGQRFMVVRLAVFAAAMVSGIIFAIVALTSVYSISGGGLNIWGISFTVDRVDEITQNYAMLGFVIFKSAISTAISVGSFLLGINWLKSLQNEESRNARVVSRFKRDLIRASWIIETVQEIRGENSDAVLPAVWLDRATHGMFDNNISGRNDENTSQLKSLLHNSKKLSIGPQGITAEMGSRGAKNLADEL